MARSLLLILILIILSVSASVSSHGGSVHDDAGAEAPSTKAPDLRSRSLILVKIWCLILLFIGTFAAGVSPYFLKWNEGFLVVGVQFSGGVFLGTALMHFLSDSNETFGDLTEKEYPFAFMLASAGYLMTMLADCAISHVYRNRDKPISAAGEVEGGGDAQHGINGVNGGYSQSGCQVNEGMEVQFAGSSTHAVARSLGDSVLLIVALCFHSVFEGIAIGVAETTGDAWRVLWTVSLHTLFAAIAMGMALLRMIPERPLLTCIAYAFAFAISTPIGVVIGIVIDATTQGDVADWIYAISMGLACGVFIYVSINHLLSKGFIPQVPAAVNSPFYKFLAATLGVGVIAVVVIWD